MTMLRGQDAQALEAAAHRLAEGGLLAFPTETVYGLGARADDDAAVARLFEAKGRPPDHPLIVHVLDVDAAQAFAGQWTRAARALTQRFWPGPVTVIVARRVGVAAAAAGGQPTIGLRCPDHPVARALLQAASRLGVRGVAGPSANRFGRVSPTRADHVIAEFGPAIWVLDGGPCPVGIESAIVDCSGERAALLRPGTVPRPELEAALQVLAAGPLSAADEASPRAPGTLASHYAPAAIVRLMTAREIAQAPRPSFPVGVYSSQRPTALTGFPYRTWPAAAAQAAHELFDVLRELDARGVREIWVERPPAGPEWEGVADRLQRAAHR